ncbi:MAG: dicarboxylate/amino acid:cation symporter [Alphaproteobacteria bacterium]
MNNLTKNILIGFVLGLIFGILVNLIDLNQSDKKLIIEILSVGGEIFLKIIKMLVVPIVFFSLTSGVANLNELNTLGKIGVKSISLYILTTFFAITGSLIFANLLNPGEGFNLKTENNQIAISEPPSLNEVLLNIIPNNPFESLVNGNMLQVIFFAILLGSAISITRKKKLTDFFNDFNLVIMKVLSISLVIAPVGIFCLISKTFATQGLGSIIELAKYFFVVVFVLILHVIFVYLPIIRLIGKTKVIKFFYGMKEALIFAFSTSSSSATIPVTLENLKKYFAVKDKIASFTVPLGATINMDGTAIMQGVATVFIANAYGFDLSLIDYVNIILTSTLASIGTAGVPGVGIIMLGMVLNQVGLPLEGIALIMGVDRFLDMLRTTVNVAGDSMVSIVINKSEKK